MDSDMHSMPSNAEDGIVAVSLRLELKGSVCDEGCWLRPRAAMQAEEERSDTNIIGGLGYVLSLAQASLPCLHENSEISESGWDLNPKIVSAWDVVSDSSAHEMGVESGMGHQGAAQQNRSEGLTLVDVEIHLEHYGASYPTVEGMHFVHATLQGPNQKTITLGDLDGVVSTSGHAIYSGWDPDLGWVGTPGRQVLHSETTVIWTPPAKKLSTLLLYHHLGMGDHLVCAGLVRRLAADYKLVLVAVHAPYLGSIHRLLRGVFDANSDTSKNIVFPFVVSREEDLTALLYHSRAAGMQVLRVGYHKDALFARIRWGNSSIEKTIDRAIRQGLSFAQVMYQHAGVAYSERSAHPFVPRDLEKEEAVWTAAALPTAGGAGGESGGGYAFVHDDPSRGLFVDRSSISQDLSVYHPSEGPRLSNVIFDYALLIERAAELHVMDSAFALLADELNLSHVRRKVLHVYARINPDGTQVVKNHRHLYRQDWELLLEPQGVMHLGWSIENPVDGDRLIKGSPSPEEYGLALHERLTLSFLDVSPFPASVRGELFWDGEPLRRGELASLHFTNKPGRYVPGACQFLANGQQVNVAERLKGSFGRCEVDLEIPWHLSTPGQHLVELRVTCANAPHAVVKTFSRFEIIAKSRADDGDNKISAPLPAPPPPPYLSNEGGLIRVAVSTGEAVDKLTILNIKVEKIKDQAKLHNIRKESSLLAASIERAMGDTWLENALFQELLSVNTKLWEVEDEVRRCEAKKDFGSKFVQLARSVYHLNDERGRLKRRISALSSSGLIEEKLYASY